MFSEEPSPTPTPTPTLQPFELPISYSSRPDSNVNEFKDAFWGQLTAAFDHHRGGPHQPFTGEKYKKKDCQTGDYGIECYNSHNGTDFDDILGDPDSQVVYSVAEGKVIYTSTNTNGDCPDETSGFGCVVIAKYDNTHSGTVYGLFAHLDEIDVNEDQLISVGTPVGKIGSTGCEPCGPHLHFGVLKEVGTTKTSNVKSKKKMSKKDWQALLYEIRPGKTPRLKHYCTYNAPNNMTFTFQDPSGWKGKVHDPWEKSCGVESPYLWKFDVGVVDVSQGSQESSFLNPLKNFLNI